jgi:hypothetical protein
MAYEFGQLTTALNDLSSSNTELDGILQQFEPALRSLLNGDKTAAAWRLIGLAMALGEPRESERVSDTQTGKGAVASGGSSGGGSFKCPHCGGNINVRP